MKIHFNELFIYSNGKITPLVTVQIGGVSISPGATMNEEIQINGISLKQITNHFLEVTLENGIYRINGVYTN
jgi:ribosomal protein L11